MSTKNPRPPTPSASASPSPDLQQAINALILSTKVIYFNFEFVFKLAGLLLLAFLAFKIGKMSVSEAIAKKVQGIEGEIRRIEDEKDGLPLRIQRIGKFYFRVIVACVGLALAAGGLLYTGQIKLDPLYLSPLLIIPIALYITKTIHISNLSTKNKQFASQQKKIHEKVKQLNKALGPKVQNSLKSTLCRQKLSAKQNTPSHICNKKQCQEHRELLRSKYEVIRNLAECALQFQWCSACRGRKVFDQLVKFQARPMPVRDGEVSEEEDADMKIGYLLEILEEIDRWIQEAGPCNCTKLYMEEIVKNRKNANRQLKEINARIEQHERMKQAAAAATTATITRTDSRMSASSYTSNVSSNAGSSNQVLSSSGRVYYVNKKQ